MCAWGGPIYYKYVGTKKWEMETGNVQEMGNVDWQPPPQPHCAHCLIWGV